MIMNKKWSKKFFITYVKRLAAIHGVCLISKKTDEYDAPGFGSGGSFRFLVLSNDLTKIKESNGYNEDKAVKFLKKNDGKMKVWCEYGATEDDNARALYDAYLKIATSEQAQELVDTKTIKRDAEQVGSIAEVLLLPSSLLDELENISPSYTEALRKRLCDDTDYYYLPLPKRKAVRR